MSESGLMMSAAKFVAAILIWSGIATVTVGLILFTDSQPDISFQGLVVLAAGAAIGLAGVATKYYLK